MSETVLVVDDEAEIRELAREALEPLGYTVLDSGDPQQTLRMVKSGPFICFSPTW